MTKLRKYTQRLRWWFIRQHTCYEWQCRRLAIGSTKIDHSMTMYWCRDHFIAEIERIERIHAEH